MHTLHLRVLGLSFHCLREKNEHIPLPTAAPSGNERLHAEQGRKEATPGAALVEYFATASETSLSNCWMLTCQCSGRSQNFAGAALVEVLAERRMLTGWKSCCKSPAASRNAAEFPSVELDPKRNWAVTSREKASESEGRREQERESGIVRERESREGGRHVGQLTSRIAGTFSWLIMTKRISSWVMEGGIFRFCIIAVRGLRRRDKTHTVRR